MELDLFGQGLIMLANLWSAILSKEQNGFCSRNAPLFVHADLKEFTYPASVGKCQHGQCAAKKHAAIQALKIQEEFLPALCLCRAPAIPRVE